MFGHRTSPLEIARGIAMKGGSFADIEEQLARKEMSGLLTDSQMEEILYEAACQREIRRKRPARKLAWVVGSFGIVIGLAGLVTGTWSHILYGRLITIFIGALAGGILLIAKPSLQNFKLPGNRDERSF